MKILVTGATGLLGSDIIYTLASRGIETVKACFSERGSDYIAANITTEEGIKKLADQEWDAMIHTSAWRKPDECETKQEETYRLNVWAAEQLALEAGKRNARMVFISTDYVFSGNNPPYKEDAPKDPINYYGKTKDMAEEKILEISDKFCVLRVPLLYGIRAGLKASDVLNAALNAINSKNESKMDDLIVRYPTFTGDVAEAALFLLEKNASGIFHFSGQDKTTKYGIAKTIAKVTDKDMSKVLKVNVSANDNAPRPMDSHLSVDRLLSLGFKLPLPFEERVKELFQELKILS